MKLQPLLWAASAAAFVVPFALAQESGEGGLQRVQPLEENAPQDPTLHAPFAPELWRRSLSEPNLDLRMRDYERLLRVASVDEGAWDFLRELAQDASAPELAWTARLALRELESAPRRQFFRPFAGPRVRLSDPFTDIDELLEELGMGGGLRPMLDGQRHGISEERRVEIQNDGSTWRVRIHAVEDGEETTREYTGESLEAILEANPELAEELDVSHLGGGPEGFRVELGLPLEAPLEEIFEGFEGFRTLHPGQSFEWRDPSGAPRKLHLFVGPQAKSQPLRTDVLGVRVAPITPEFAAELRLDESVGLYVQATYPGTIAHLLGVRTGDVLVELGGRVLSSAEDITRHMQERRENDSVRVAWVDASGVRQDRAWYPDGKGPQEEDF